MFTAPNKSVHNTKQECSQHQTRVFTTPNKSVHSTKQECSQHQTRVFTAPNKNVHSTKQECSQHQTRVFTAPNKSVHSTKQECSQHQTRMFTAPNNSYFRAFLIHRGCFRIEGSLVWCVEHLIYQLVMFTKQLQMNFLFGFQPLYIIPGGIWFQIMYYSRKGACPSTIVMRLELSPLTNS